MVASPLLLLLPSSLLLLSSCSSCPPLLFASSSSRLLGSKLPISFSKSASSPLTARTRALFTVASPRRRPPPSSLSAMVASSSPSPSTLIPSSPATDMVQVLSSFPARTYRPPWWARQAHVNTIVGALFATPPTPSYERERWTTPDGDFVDIDFLRSELPASRGIVLLYHGLESNSLAPLTVRQARSLSMAGFDVAAIGFRGCSGEDNLTPGGYHLGFTDDVHFIAKRLHE
ncbi:hypothetical protein GUITHDRAFT_149647, partial [Guillardia theta CCMP2712]